MLIPPADSAPTENKALIPGLAGLVVCLDLLWFFLPQLEHRWFTQGGETVDESILPVSNAADLPIRFASEPKGKWVWADVGPTLEESPTNPNKHCFTLVWMPDEDAQ